MMEPVLTFLVNHPEVGWIVVGGLGIEQLFAPWETKTKKMVGNVEKKIDEVEKRIDEMHQGMKAQMTVVRALARVHEDIDTDAVDEYLIENGTSPDDFIQAMEHDRSGVIKDED